MRGNERIGYIAALARLLPTRDRRTAEQAAVPPALRELPLEAAAIAAEHARELGAEVVQQPLERFLTQVSQKEGVKGVALAIWRSPSTPPCLAVYSLMGKGTSEETTSAVSEAFAQLNTRVRAEAPPLSCGLSFVGTRGEDLTTLIPAFERTLSTGGNPFVIRRSTKDYISRFTAAKTT